MTIERVQGHAQGNATSGQSITITLASTPIAGNLLILCAGIKFTTSGAGSVSSIAQTNVVWTKQVNSTGGYYTSEIWVGVVGASASDEITVTVADANIDVGICDVCEYSGLATSDFLDKTATNNGGSSPTDTGTTATTTQNDELWVGCTTAHGDLNQSSPTNGFTMLDGQKVVYTQSTAFLEKIVSSTGTANSGTTATGTDAWYGSIATFKAPAAPGGNAALRWTPHAAI